MPPSTPLPVFQLVVIKRIFLSVRRGTRVRPQVVVFDEQGRLLEVGLLAISPLYLQKHPDPPHLPSTRASARSADATASRSMNAPSSWTSPPPSPPPCARTGASMKSSVALATPHSPAEAHRRLPPEHAARVEQEHIPLLQPLCHLRGARARLRGYSTRHHPAGPGRRWRGRPAAGRCRGCLRIRATRSGTCEIRIAGFSVGERQNGRVADG
jgi:hypothetical protein